ncbi:hypothetical protein [Rufibacter latericius]|uniref:hypothetical protein n=1 Tax=Rufibacter latericius TaxID=2487040 RepID=UPI001D0442C2|nr:hypothetical protein [Rufibacter latericius]
MMWCISDLKGTSVVYLRLMFCTPRPTLDTSSLPSFRRPLTVAAFWLESPALPPVELAASVVQALGSMAAPASSKPVLRRSRRFIPLSLLLFVVFSMVEFEW